MKSKTRKLNKADLKKIGLNILIFNAPVFFLTTLTAYIQGMGIKQALITASVCFWTAVVDIVRKYKHSKK